MEYPLDSHPYYKVLQGPDATRYVTVAGAIASLFEVVELAGADFGYPDRETYTSGDRYFHPDLRISVHGYGEWDDAHQEFANFLLKNPMVRQHLHSDPKLHEEREAKHFLCRLISQMRIAARMDAVLVGNEFFETAYHIVLRYMDSFFSRQNQIDPGVLTISQEVLAIAGLNFAPADFSELVAVRQSSEITAYATEFREAIGSAHLTNDFAASLKELMREALETHEIRKRAKSILNTTSTVSTTLGAIPMLGTVASLAGLASDFGSRRIDRKKSDWYLIGPRMKEVAIEDYLQTD